MQRAIDIRTFMPGERETVKPASKGPLWVLPFSRKITDAEKADFLTQLSVMLLARVPLHQALEVLKVQKEKSRMADVIAGVLKEVQGGVSFSVALSRQPSVFDELVVVTAEVGQESGMLAEVLARLATHMEKMVALRKKFAQAMTYPLLVLAVAAFAVGFLLIFIVPAFAEMFRSFQSELPWSTEVVLSMSDALTSYGLIVLLSALIFAFVGRGILVRRDVRTRLERLVIKIPLIGQMILKNYVARFCRSLGTQLKAQVSLVDALDTTRRVISNPDLQQEIEQMIRHVKQGRTVSQQVTASRLFPPMVAQMITVGEETSELDEMLLKVAEYYEREIDGKVEQLSSVAEPIIVLILGLMVAGILIAMYLPMFDLVNVING